MIYILILAFYSASQSDSDAAAREALRKCKTPWYDVDKDSLKRIELPLETPPEKERNERSDATPNGSAFSFLQFLGWAAVAAIVIAFAVMLIRSNLLQDLESPGFMTKEMLARIDALPMPLKKNEFDPLEAARRYYESGDYSKAMVYLFAYELLILDRNHVIRLEKGKTNRQYLREIRGDRSQLRKLYEIAMVAFEDVFFGHRPLEQDRFEACWSALNFFENPNQPPETASALT